MQRRGWYPEVLASLDQMTEQADQLGAGLQQSPLAERYPAVQWAGLFAKLGDLAAGRCLGGGRGTADGADDAGVRRC